MKKLLFTMFLLVGMLSFTNTAKSSHVVGGDTQWIQTGPNQYKVIFRMFRYCDGITYSTSLNTTVKVNGTNLTQTTFTANRDSIVTLTFGDECYTPPGLCVEVWYYSGTVTLPNNPAGYYCTYTTCCRNGGIKNIMSTGGIWTAQIPDPAISGRNTNPKFAQYPRTGYFCIGNNKDFDFSCTDPDGDSLVYSLENPLDRLTSGGKPHTLTAYRAGYNLTNNLGPGSMCIINSATGIVTARPAATGLYVLSVKCEEYRNGTKIGEVIRDIQLVALNCKYNRLPEIKDKVVTETLKFDKTGCFDIVATDPDDDTFFIEVVSNAFAYGATVSLPTPNSAGKYEFSWIDTSGNTDTANIAGIKQVTKTKFSGVSRVGMRFCWDLTDCAVLEVDTFRVNVYGFSIGCDASIDSVTKEYKIVIDKKEYSHVVPNVFSPNGDKINDTYFLKQDQFDRCFDALTVRIYNRWGQKVFESDDAKFEWNGRDETGNELSEGTYYVVLQGYYGGREVTNNFPITLFR